MRCQLCGLRLYKDESALSHEFSGRCLARPAPAYDEQGNGLVTLSDSGGRRPAARPVGRTINRRPPAHGTRSRYVSPKHRCRCAPCMKAMNDYAAIQRAKRRANA